MEELINEVKQIIRVHQHSLERLKKNYDVPFSSNCDHYYRLIVQDTTVEIWSKCIEVLMKYKKSRCEPLENFQSNLFKEILEKHGKDFFGFPMKRTRFEVIEYMRKLEWRIEQLEGELL